MRHIRFLISLLITFGYPLILSHRVQQSSDPVIITESNQSNKTNSAGRTLNARLQKVYDHINIHYVPALILVARQDRFNMQSTEVLRQHVVKTNDLYNATKKGFLNHNPYQDLPFLQYKHNLNKTTKLLAHYGAKLSKKMNSKEIQFHAVVTNQLTKLNDAIISMREYHREKIKVAQIHDAWPINLLKSGILPLLRKFVMPF